MKNSLTSSVIEERTKKMLKMLEIFGRKIFGSKLMKYIKYLENNKDIHRSVENLKAALTCLIGTQC